MNPWNTEDWTGKDLTGRPCRSAPGIKKPESVRKLIEEIKQRECSAIYSTIAAHITFTTLLPPQECASTAMLVQIVG